MNRSVEIISIGNELLEGHTLNTNAHWLAKIITSNGGVIRRFTVVRDEIDEIADSIRESIGRKCSWIIVSGGLGPTYDDKTLQGLAKALRLKLIVNKEAIRMLKYKYLKISNPTLTAPRYKMAKLPVGSKALENMVGHAPGVMLEHGSCTIFVVPGVPQELKSIFSIQILPILKRRIGRYVREERVLEVKEVMESVLAPYLDMVVDKNPNVYVKSHPKGFNKGVSMLNINIIAEASEKRTVKKNLIKAVRQMRLHIKEAGGKVKQI